MMATSSNYVEVINAPNGLILYDSPGGNVLWVGNNYASIENGQRFIPTGATQIYNGDVWYQIFVTTNVKYPMNGTSQLYGWTNGNYLTYSGCSSPSIQASNISFSSVSSNSLTVSWTNGNGSNRIVVAKLGSSIGGSPVAGNSYSGNANFGSGTQIANGEYVVYNGSGSSVPVSGLTAGVNYYFRVFEYSCSSLQYNISASAGNPGSQFTLSSCNLPGTPVISLSPLPGSQVYVSWNSVANATNYDVYYSSGSCPWTNGTLYTNTTANNSTVSGLNPNSIYKFIVIAKNSPSCTATSSCMSCTTQGTGCVLFSGISNSPTSRIVSSPAPTTFTATPQGNGTSPAYTWEYQQPGNGWIACTSSNYTFNTTGASSTLTINNTTGLDQYQFHCIITNPCCTIPSNPCLLNVNSTPQSNITVTSASIPPWQRANDDYTISATCSTSTGSNWKFIAYNPVSGQTLYSSQTFQSGLEGNWVLNFLSPTEPEQISYSVISSSSNPGSSISLDNYGKTSIIKTQWLNENIVLYNQPNQELSIPIKYVTGATKFEIGFERIQLHSTDNDVLRPLTPISACLFGLDFCDSYVNANGYLRIPTGYIYNNNLLNLSPGVFKYTLFYLNNSNQQIGSSEISHFDLTKIGNVNNSMANATDKNKIVVLVGGITNTIENNILGLTHSLNTNSHEMWSIADDLSINSSSNKFNTWYIAQGNLNSVQKNAYNLGMALDSIRSICLRNGAQNPQINVIAHSKGGLEMRLLVDGKSEYLGGNAVFTQNPVRPFTNTNISGALRSIIFLGTPHRGINRISEQWLAVGNFNFFIDYRNSQGFIDLLNESPLSPVINYLNTHGSNANNIIVANFTGYGNAIRNGDGGVNRENSEYPTINNSAGVYQYYIKDESNNNGGYLHGAFHKSFITNDPTIACRNCQFFSICNYGTISILDRIRNIVNGAPIDQSCAPPNENTWLTAFISRSILSGAKLRLRDINGVYNDIGISDEYGIVNIGLENIPLGDTISIEAAGSPTLYFAVDSELAFNRRLLIPMIKSQVTNKITYPSLISNQSYISTLPTFDLFISSENTLQYQICSPINQDSLFLPITLNSGHYFASLDTGYNLLAVRFIGSIDTVILYKTVYYLPGTLINELTKYLTVTTSDNYLGSKVYLNNNYLSTINQNIQQINILDGSGYLKICKLGYKDTIYELSNLNTINLILEPINYSSELDSTRLDFDLNGGMQYWKNITVNKYNTTTGTIVKLKQCEDTLPSIGLIPLSRCFDFYNISSSGYPILRTAICLDQVRNLSKDSTYLLFIKNDSLYSKALFDSTGICDFDSIVQKLYVNPIDFDSGRVAKEEIRIMKRLAPIALHNTYSINQNSTLSIPLDSLFADPDSLKNDMTFLIGTIGTGLTVAINNNNVNINSVSCYYGNTHFVITAIHDGIAVNSTINLSVGSIPTISSNSPVCSGSTINLSASSGLSYSWNGPNNFISALQNPSILNGTSNNSGDYFVTITNVNGCVSTLTTNVQIGVSVPADSWTQIMPFGGGIRQGCAGFTIGNSLYVGTGGDSICRKDFWKWDPLTNTWTRLADFPGNARYGAIGFAIGNKGYLGTGYDYTNYYSDFWEYDPITDSWTRKNDFLGGSRFQAVGFAIGNKGYIGTGNDDVTDYNDFWEWDPLSNTWTRKSDIQGLARRSASGFVIGQKGYLGIGTNGLTGSLNDFWVYDQLTNLWSPIAVMTQGPRADACGFSILNKGYISTGILLGVSRLNDIWEYDPSINQWSQKAILPGSCRDHAFGVSIGSKGYVGTGYSGTWYFQDFYEYNPELSIITSSISPQQYCAGDSIHIPFVISGAFCSNNEFTAQLSDSTGDFSTPINIGSLVTSNSATIHAVIPPSVLQGTHYRIRVISNNATVVGSVNPEDIIIGRPNGSISSNSPVCLGDTINLFSGGGIVYSWVGPNGFMSNSQNPIILNSIVSDSGTYTLNVTDAAGCQLNINTYVSILSNHVTVESNSPVCSGQSINLSANGGSSYAWNGPNGFISNDPNPVINNATLSNSGTYSIEVLNTTGCGNITTSISVNVNPSPLASISTTNVLCAGDSNATAQINTSALGGTPPYSYLWNNGETSSSITGLVAGTYAVNIIDVHGCSDDTTFELSNPDLLNISFPQYSIYSGGYNVSCSGASDGFLDLYINGGTPPYIFNWNNGQYTTQNLTTIPGGNYSVLVTDANNCTATGNFSLTEPLPIQLDSLYSPSGNGGYNISCAGELSGEIFTSVSGGISPYTYLWSGPGSYSSSDADPRNLAAGLYLLNVADVNGCSISNSITLTESSTLYPLIVSASINGVNIRCFNGSDGLAYVNEVNGGTPPYHFEWSNGITDTVIQQVPSGTYDVHIVDTNGCTFDETIFLNQPDPLETILRHSNYNTYGISCNGANDGFIILDSFFGGIPPYTYNWSSGGSFDSIGNLLAGNYTLRITDLNGCMDSVLTVLTEPLPIVAGININGDTLSTSCAYDSCIFQWYYGTDTTSYIPLTNSDVDTMIAMNEGYYYVEITDSIGCNGVSNSIYFSILKASIDENHTEIQVYPNPNNGSFTVEIKGESNISSPTSLRLYTGMGVMVAEQLDSRENKFEFQLENSIPGIYIIEVVVNKHFFRSKLVIY
ncbi:MAG: T9SS type A sorting domain-containing protein [Bacteroidetes bacterium]|nr:T9SS type A sorting domain-containing protein [Bacteroidota bacterium]